ncbi:hypothetical protein SMKI_12G1560 [Saccharomyces mikatae IFO 1815]|uniref:Actin-like protein ARP6 n=1 Tax=Saccharomyces mikatae IFO 1815 TaxID=226126 RepID=A0AA35IQH1_SACMI|nr:uncharacterized protein SMKI_12G1560 [Saccharomyces mikatae IFO 1815]CAI4035018.1 hypothetical protein SMKI_12G1560 [Saccharomyces mikatae IFO 1815]
METAPIVIDNGSYEIKFGPSTNEKPFRALNALAKDKFGTSYLSNHIKNIKDISSVTFRRPHELGQLTLWELESCIWDYCFFNPIEFDGFDLKEGKGHHLVASESCMTLPELSKHADQVIFEEYEFDSLFKSPVAAFVPFTKSYKSKMKAISGKDEDADIVVSKSNEADMPSNNPRDTQKFDSDYHDFQLVIDSGFNCTWIIPVLKGIPYYKAVKKLDVGGRFLTGLLKETLSFRHYNMMDETILVNNIKEKCLFVSPVSYFDSFKVKDKHALEYVLPDFQTSFLGYVRNRRKENSPLAEDAQTITLTDELFTIPETFFHPEIAQITKPGIVEAILESLSMLPEIVRPLMVGNIVCTGGNFNLPNFAQRLAAELQRQLPTDWTCHVSVPESDCALFGWEVMSQFSSTASYRNARVTREEYYEHGSDWCTKHRFGYQNWI